MATALYRISSSEVVKISLTNQQFSDRNQTYWGVLTSPALTDGDQAVDANGNLRVLGVAKFAVVGSNTVRNATVLEIATFATAESADEAAMDAAEAVALFETHPCFRKAFKAIIKRIIAENNLQAAQWNAFRTQVALATNLADLKTRTATNTANMPVRTNAQGYTALAGDVSSGD